MRPSRWFRRIEVLLLAVVSGRSIGCHRPRADMHPPLDRVPLFGVAIEPLPADDELGRRACADPLAFLRMCREHYLETVRDYRCVFHIREGSGDPGESLGPEQEIKVRFRERPYSVDMRWTRNPIHASRVNYVAGRWRRGNREHAMIYPSGLLGVLAPSGVKADIHSPQIRAASRRAVDDFGFRRTLEIMTESCEKARAEAVTAHGWIGSPQSGGVAVAEPAYELRCVGQSVLDDRPCLVLKRLLPYRHGDRAYPDRLLFIYIDRQWLVPTGCFAFADDLGERPLGTYVTTSVEMNVGLGDDDF
jgi:hypothetical protein